MLACVCRPVTGSLPKPPPSTMPQKRSSPIVVTCEPRIATATIVKKKVPGRPTAAELRAMALRQQQQIDSQHQLLAAKEQRLRFLKAQESRGAVAAAEGERLRRLRERVETQESKLRRLRALRGQVDLQKTYNVTLSNDLDSIRALFSEKEKELSLAVAKVEALTRQLEELRRDRRGPLNLIPGGAPGSGNNQQLSSPAARELEKLRRELMYRNQLSLQQDARLHLQREALQQRQAELRSVDQRILELQTRLQRKKASNLVLQSQQASSQQQQQCISNQQSTQTNNQNVLAPTISTSHSHSSSSTTNLVSIRPSNSVYPSQRLLTRGNVAAVEPYIHTPQKSSITSTANLINSGHLIKQSAATANTNQQNQLIQDLTNLKLNLSNVNTNISVNHYAESDESKLARQKFNSKTGSTKDVETDSVELNSKQSEQKNETLPYNSKISKNNLNISPCLKSNECDSEKAGEISVTSETVTGKGAAQQLTVHSTPLSTVNKSVAVAVSAASTTSVSKTNRYSDEKPAIKPKAVHQIPSGNLVVPPRKPISSVAPTSVTTTITKIVTHSPKVNMVAPNIISQLDNDKSRPALPPKPSRATSSFSDNSVVSTAPTVVSVINKAPISEPSESQTQSTSSSFLPSNPDNLPIKAKPLTIRKQPLSEQPRLKSLSSGVKPLQNNSRRIEMPPAFLFPEIESTELKSKVSNQPVLNTSSNTSNDNISNNDETDKSASSSTLNEEKMLDDVKRRVRHLSDNGKVKLARRVSFDPLALLLDASLEGELELVKKTAMQVPNPSAANDEGITALHNAICAGHFEIVKFLVDFGCDVNAQDSDGWTPLHCAASCNNLAMVKFLVENGACLFAATLSDHETPAEKCEEDEEGFDGCSEYLYSIQEKLGILNNGEVFAVFSYDAQQPDELSFNLNDRLTILRKGDDAEREWWWAKNTNDEEGYVPRNLLGFPTTVLEWKKISKDFEDKWNFPHCLGAVDGKHIQIIPPTQSGSYYFNYKKTHSIVLMAIANANYEFIMCDIGTNGRVSDGGVIDNTTFMKRLLANKLNLPTAEPVVQGETPLNYIFVGDEAFALRPDFLKPYNQRELDYEKRIYNYRLSRARRIVENAFGILANRFRIFHTAINLKIDNIDKVVLACCALHNFLRRNCSDTYTSNDVFDTEDTAHGTITHGLRGDSNNLLNLQKGYNQNHTADAKEVREQFKTYFNNSGKVSWQHRMVSN